MNDPLQACLLSLLQRGITEARTCALQGDARKAADLLDALDNVPRHLHVWSEASEQEIVSQFSAFQQAHPDHDTDYLDLFRRRTAVL